MDKDRERVKKLFYLSTKIEKNLKSQLPLIKNEITYSVWIRHCKESIELLTHTLSENKQSSVGFKQHMIAVIGRLKCLVEGVRHRRWHSGAGLGEKNATESPSAASFLQWKEVESVFESRITTGMVVNIMHIDPKQFLLDCKNIVFEQVRQSLEKHNCIKVNCTFTGEFVITHVVQDGIHEKIEEKTDDKTFSTKNAIILHTTDLDDWYLNQVVNNILTSLEEFQERDSGWALSKIVNFLVNINKCQMAHGSGYAKLPTEIAMKRAVVNVKSNDNACFAWAIVAALHPNTRNAHRITSYPHYKDVLNLEGITFPTKFKQIPTFERNNQMSINVFILKRAQITKKFECFPLQISSFIGTYSKHVNLLFFETTIGWHYAWIRSLSRLVSSQINNEDHRKVICCRCLNFFYNEEKLENHSIHCGKHNNCRIDLPAKDGKNFASFKSTMKKEPLPFIIYADFECLLKKLNTSSSNEDSANKSNRCAYQEHIPYSIGYYFHNSLNTSLSKYKSYRGEDCAKWFADELSDIAATVSSWFTTIVPIQASEADVNDFNNATHCYICEQVFSEGQVQVRDHCHLTGRYRGAAHVACNLNYQQSHAIPIIFHNLSNYDAHFLIKSIATDLKGSTNVIATTLEKYIAFTKSMRMPIEGKKKSITLKFKFIDSFKFLNAGLSKIASTITKDDMVIMRSNLNGISETEFDLLSRKGVFPYDYVDSWEKLENITLPTHEQFYNKLTNCNISKEEYKHAENVWTRFNVQTLGEYSDLYLKTDVLLLADVFETFRLKCQKSYSLDPAHYITVPGYAWDVMLKTTKIKLELLTDIDMVMFIERGIRGGLSQCSHRHAKANNKYMNEYDSSKETSFLMYYDVNNLYGWAMTQALPYQNFQWKKEFDDFDVMLIDTNSTTGYILEVDLEYPKEIHDLHADLPFCTDHDNPPNSKYKKLLATLHDKEHYVIHYRSLQQCLRAGLKLRKIHKILQFDQSAWLSSYIEINTKLRQSAQSEFEKNLYKLMNNAVFGKTMENVRNHIDVKLATEWDGRYGAAAYIAQPNFHRHVTFHRDLIGIQMTKLNVVMNKPIYVGMSILDISKICLYDFHYDFMKPQLKENCKILYTDTDSLIYCIKNRDIYDIMKKNSNHFDTSDYSKNNVYNMPRVNKKVPGLMKDECNGQILQEFVGLRSKMYTFKIQGQPDVKKVKGISRNIVQRKIMFDDYLDCLQNQTIKINQQSGIRSKNHKVFTISERKVSLDPHDDKRCLSSIDYVSTLPWGHYSLTEDKM